MKEMIPVRVQLGFSGELHHNQWRKADIDVDEVDFARILKDAELDIDPADVPRRIKFTIMEAEATTLLYAEMANFGGDAREIETRIKQATAQMQEGLERIRTLGQ